MTDLREDEDTDADEDWFVMIMSKTTSCDRCVLCGLYTYPECSGYVSPEGYICYISATTKLDRHYKPYITYIVMFLEKWKFNTKMINEINLFLIWFVSSSSYYNNICILLINQIDRWPDQRIVLYVTTHIYVRSLCSCCR